MSYITATVKRLDRHRKTPGRRATAASQGQADSSSLFSSPAVEQGWKTPGVQQHMWRKMPLHGISNGDI